MLKKKREANTLCLPLQNFLIKIYTPQIRASFGLWLQVCLWYLPSRNFIVLSEQAS